MTEQPQPTTTNSTTDTLFIDSVPCLSFPSLHQGWVSALVVLSDGSLVSCSADRTVKRWLIELENGKSTKSSEVIRLVGTCIGHEDVVMCAVEIDNETIVTGSLDRTLRVWNKTTCECLRSFSTHYGVFSLIRSNDGLRILCGMFSGAVEMRRTDDLGVILASFKPHSGIIDCICELEDGSFVSGSTTKTIKRWDRNGMVLQTLSGHSDTVMRLIKLNSDIVVGSSRDSTVTMWKVSTGQLLHKLTLHTDWIDGLMKLSEDKFVTASWDHTLRVWNRRGECIGTITTDCGIRAMTRLGDSIVTVDTNQKFEVRRLKYDPYHLSRQCYVLIKTQRTRLLDRCCLTIASNKEHYNVNDLERILPRELFDTCFKQKTVWYAAT